MSRSVDVDALAKELIAMVKWDVFNIDNMMEDGNIEVAEERRKMHAIIIQHIRSCECEKLKAENEELLQLASVALQCSISRGCETCKADFEEFDNKYFPDEDRVDLKL